MSDFKEKLKSLVLRNDNKWKIPSMGFCSELYEQYQTKKTDRITSVNSVRVNIDEDKDFSESRFEEIKSQYSTCNDIEYTELQRVCKNLSKVTIENEITKLKNDQRIVCKKLQSLIIERQEKFDNEFQDISYITNDIGNALEKVKYSRLLLNQVKNRFSNHIMVLANFRKRQLLKKLLENLVILKSLYKSSDRIYSMIAEEKYQPAIILLQESLNLSKNCPQYACIESLENKLQDIKIYLEEFLDKCLESLCVKFCSELFKKLQEAYQLLNNDFIIIDQLCMHYTSTIYTKSLAIAQEFTLKSLKHENIMGKQYSHLASLISTNQFLPCLITLCNEMLTILNSYYQLVNYYKNFDMNIEYNIYIKEKLLNGIVKIWNEVQNKIKIILENCNGRFFTSFENIIKLLRLIKRMTKVGEDFLNCSHSLKANLTSETIITLEESINKSAYYFFNQFHKTKLDELFIFFENESWLKCPIRSKFNIKDMREFWSLRTIQDEFSDELFLSNPSSGNSDNDQLPIFNQNLIFTENLFDNCNFESNNFDSEEDYFQSIHDSDCVSYSSSSSLSSSSSSSVPSISSLINRLNISKQTNENIKKKSEIKSNMKNIKPIVTNSTLNAFRIIGRYLHISQSCSSFQNCVVLSCIQIFYSYIWVIYTLFSCDSTHLIKQICSTNFLNIIESMPLHHNQYKKFHLKRPAILSNLQEDLLLREIISAESAIFFAQQFSQLKCYVENMNSAQRDDFKHMINIAIDLRKAIYLNISSTIVNKNEILNAIKSTNWNFKEISSQQSTYIDLILKQMQIFLTKFDKHCKDIPNFEKTKEDLLQIFALYLNNILIEGYSSIKKCSTAGRALMQLDLTQLEINYVKLTHDPTKIMPHRQLTDNFIKSFYLPDAEFENWLINHKEYSITILKNLIEYRYSKKKQLKQHLMALVSDEHFFL